jgi:CTP synthase (UTP-ammonia lyase)
MANAIRIGIIGDFNPSNPTHVATNDGLTHAAEALEELCDVRWLPTDEPQEYERFQALFCSPGSPYKSLAGALRGVQYAREHRVPFLGTCGGFQHLVIEYARNVMGFRDAAHAEYDPYASCLFVSPLSCSPFGKAMEITIKPGTRAAAIYGSTSAKEKYYCNFGLNPAYQQQLVKAGLEMSGSDSSGEARIVELPSHPFFFGTLFVPQASSAKGNPHPIVVALLRAATRRLPV